MKKIGIIIGSVREPRKGIVVGRWVLEQAQTKPDHYDIIDLQEYNLPHFIEPSSPRTADEYTFETTKRWSTTIKQYDAYIWVTPEYNGFFPGSVKDAVDYLYHEWENKPYAIVGYGGRGAKWASEHLQTLLKRFDMVDCGWVGIHKPGKAIQDDGSIDDEYIEGSLDELFETLHNA